MPNILLKPVMGLNLLALGAIAIHAKFNPPEEPARKAVTISTRNNGKNKQGICKF